MSKVEMVVWSPVVYNIFSFLGEEEIEKGMGLCCFSSLNWPKTPERKKKKNNPKSRLLAMDIIALFHKEKQLRFQHNGMRGREIQNPNPTMFAMQGRTSKTSCYGHWSLGMSGPRRSDTSSLLAHCKKIQFLYNSLFSIFRWVLVIISFREAYVGSMAS